MKEIGKSLGEIIFVTYEENLKYEVLEKFQSSFEKIWAIIIWRM